MRYITLTTAAVLAAVTAGCGSAPKEDPKLAAMNSCLIADVSSNDEVLTITNTGRREWADLSASFLEGGTGNTSFDYAKRNKVVQPGETLTIPLSQFVREDGLRYDPARYARQGIQIDTDQGQFYNFEPLMVPDARGMYRNECESKPARP